MAQSSKLRSAFYVISGGTSLFAAYSLYTGNSKFYRQIIFPSVNKILDGESSHRLVVKLASFNLLPKCKLSAENEDLLSSKVWNLEFSNPVGLAAGFDKHAECMTAMLNTGFGFVEVGSVTPKPQAGNDKPRVFRLEEDKAVINRYGFNSDGHEVVFKRISAWRKNAVDSKEKVLGVNLGKNKESSVEKTIDDYCAGIEKFYDVADYIVVNISSPNTPGLREWQGKEMLSSLLSNVTQKLAALESLQKGGQRRGKPILLVKISCDVDDWTKGNIASVILKNGAVDGLIISNTSSERPRSLQNVEHAGEAGGLSGAPIRARSTALVRDMYQLTGGRVPIVGCGGVSTGEDAYEKIRAGACLVQLYTGLVYEGPLVAADVARGLADCLKRDGYSNVAQAVGADHRLSPPAGSSYRGTMTS